VVLLAVSLAAITSSVLPHPAVAQEISLDAPGLSPYWNSAVTQWESLILRYADERDLDPDFMAAVIWKESLGRATARSAVGAVGLMQLMPRPNRPSPAELENPWTNLFWGARALAHTIRDGDGDLYYSLAAYNGGWGQIHLSVTRGYATGVLDCYSRAVAERNGLSADGEWIAVFAVDGVAASNTITVLGPHRPLARYTKRPWIQADVPTVPVGVAPHATAITFVNEQGVEGRVHMWLLAEDGSPLALPATQAASVSTSPTGVSSAVSAEKTLSLSLGAP
jgi:hypothetical protein